MCIKHYSEQTAENSNIKLQAVASRWAAIAWLARYVACAVNSNAINSTGLPRLGAASLADRPSALRSVCLHSGIFV